MEYIDKTDFIGGLTPDEAQELDELEAALRHNGGRGVDAAERIDELRRLRGWLTEEEAADEADNLNSTQDDVTWQTAYVNDGFSGEGYWIIVEGEGCDDPGPDCEIHEGACD